MKVIRFKTEGIFNSYKIPFFRKYHKSFLAPPKTVIIGMLANIMRKPEKWYYDILNKDRIFVSVVIDAIAGKAKDLWAYKTLKNKSGMHGRAIMRRDRLFNARYTIYLMMKDKELFSEVLNALKYPKSIPSLGLDDEIVNIYEVREIELGENLDKKINSVFMDKGYGYEAIIKEEEEWIELPVANLVPLRYDVKFPREEPRIEIDRYRQVEYINCEVFIDGASSYTDGINRVVFY